MPALRAAVLCGLAAAAAARPGGAPALVAGEGALAVLSRSLPPFTALELGRASCMPISVHVVEGNDYSLDITAQARRGGAARRRARGLALGGLTSLTRRAHRPTWRRRFRARWTRAARCRSSWRRRASAPRRR